MVCWLGFQKDQNRHFFDGSDVSHSLRRLHNRREIDITLALHSNGSLPVVFLVENKLDTSEQVQQAESYAEEAKVLVQSGRAKSVRTVLICPNAYVADAPSFAGKFDAVVTYEEIASFLASRAQQEEGELAARLAYREQLLHQAIYKARRGYQPVPMVAIERFNAKYVETCRQICPDLKPGPSMLKEGRPGESKTMIFAADALPRWSFLPQMRLVHQLREGNANLCFYTWGNLFTTLAGPIGRDLAGTPYRIVPAVNKRPNGKAGLMIVADTPPIDNEQAFDQQRDAIVAGIVAVDALRSWLLSHREKVEGWAQIAEAALRA